MAKATAGQAGCWIDGSRGIYATSELVQIALSYPGFLKGRDRRETTYQRTEARHILRAYYDGEETVKYRRHPRYGSSYTVTITEVGDKVSYLAEQAEQFLNEHVAPEGYLFGWNDGDFFFHPESWWLVNAA